ncbi:MAG: peptidylprolyl isomerase [Myxococcota bacterium]
MAKHPRQGNPEPPSSPRPRGLSARETQMRGHLLAQPATAALTHEPVLLPAVRAPSLEGLVIRLPPLAPLTPEEVHARYVELARSASPRRERQPGERVAAGDDVRVDLLGYSDGRLIPFSLREDVTLTAAPIPALPAFGEALVGLEVGKSAVIDLELPGDYPVAELRGRPARFLLDVHAATEVTLLPLESAALCAALCRGERLHDIMEQIATELIAEREEERLAEAEQRVLDELAMRLEVELPDRLIDEELRRRWAEQERKVALRKGFSQEEQDESLAGWKSDPATREEVRRQLRASLALKAIVDEQRLSLSAESLELLIAPTATLLGIDEKEVSAVLRQSSGNADLIADTALRLLAIEYIMARASFVLDDG